MMKVTSGWNGVPYFETNPETNPERQRERERERTPRPQQKVNSDSRAEKRTAVGSG